MDFIVVAGDAFYAMPRSIIPIDPNLGAALRRLREQRGESQERIALRSGLTAGTLVRLESGRSDPVWSTVRAVCQALDLPLSELGGIVEAEERLRAR
jgi:transcriptional regulator with XRE-family HTH domain